MPNQLVHIDKPANDELWELWCLKIFAKKYGIPGLQRYRTRGYPQEGIDLIGSRDDGKTVGIQCKLRSTETELTEKEADADLQKWLDSDLDLGVFAIACTHESTALQKWAKEKSRDGLEVTFYAWPDIADILKLDDLLRYELTDARRVNDARDELVYARALIDLRDKMNLYAIEKAATEVREPPLTAAYVSLELSDITQEGAEAQRIGGSLSIEQVMDALRSAPWRPVDNTSPADDQPIDGKSAAPGAERHAQRNNILILVGEAGRGKTTLLRYIAVQAAKARESVLQSGSPLPEYRTASRALPWRDRVPFYREVRLATSARPIEDLDQLACEILPSHPEGVARDWPRSVVKAGRALVLLDGVDEVPDGQPRVTLLANIRTLVEQNPQTLFVISSRPGAAEGLRRELAALTPREARVQALAGPKLQEFIQHWHGAVTGVAKHLYKGEAQDKRVRDIEDALYALPAKLDTARHIKSLMATPLLAALVCAYHLDHKVLPDNQTKLMTSLAYCLIDYHDRQRPGMPAWPAYSKLDENDKLSILESIAADMVKRLSPTIACDTDTPDGTKAFDDHIRAFMQTAPWFQRPDLPDLRGGLKDRTGVLHELQRGVLSFIHNEFRDFLAARHLAPQADKPEVYACITKAMTDRDWHGLIFFAVTADRDKQRPGVADRLVADLLAVVNEPPADLLHDGTKTEAEKKAAENYLSLRRVAFRLGGAKPPVTATVYEALQTVRRSMLPPATMEDAEIVSELGKNAVADLEYDAGRGAATRAACVYALRLIDHDSARNALRVYAEHETDWYVIDELVQAVPVASMTALAAIRTQPLLANNIPKQVLVAIMRQAAGLVADVDSVPALAIACALPVLVITDDEELLELIRVARSNQLTFMAQSLWTSSTGLTDESLKVLSAKGSPVSAITSLDLSSTRITDQGLAYLADKDSPHTALATLDLNHTKITDKGLAALAHKDSPLTALRSLVLYVTNVTDQGIAHLVAKHSPLTALTELNLGSTKITDQGLALLASNDSPLNALTTLKLWRNRITDQGIAHLVAKHSPLTAVADLNLARTQITDQCLALLADKDSPLTALTTLFLNETKITDRGLAHLASKDSPLTALTSLLLEGTNITDQGLAHLAAKDSSLTALTTLSLHNTKITNQGLAHLASKDSPLTALSCLDLSRTKITDEGLAHLAANDSPLAALADLSLWDTQITDRGLAVFEQRFPNIKIHR